jgi:polyisoprenyl-phosphate glycosyltransferase
MKLSLVIPCYNESSNLPLLVKRCSEVFTDPEVEVVLVNNGSTDNSAEVIARLLTNSKNIRSLHVYPNKGYGHGILCGLHAAKGDILAWTHADMQTDPADVLKGLKLFDNVERPEMIFVKGLRYGRPIGDKFFTFGMSVFETLLMGVPMRDINAQPTMFHKDFFETFDSPPNDFSLDLYAYRSAKKAELILKRFPVLFGERAHGSSHWNVDFSAKMKFVQRTWQYSLELKRQMASNKVAEHNQ